ncbi:MAG: type IV pilus assembly protein PilC [Saprospiraceae bacterium]|jgi:type IV pilus assembly protein PilC
MAKAPKTKKVVIFDWKGQNHNGVRESGEIEATTLKEARGLIQKRGIKLKKIRKQSHPIFGGDSVKNRDVVVLSRQLATMVEGGIPIAQALSVVGQSSDNRAVKILLAKMRMNVEEGEDLTSTLRKHPKHFNSLYVGLVNVGEESGTLGPMLGRIAAYLEKAEAMRRKIKSALMYPVIVMSVGLIIVAGLLIFIIPQFQSLFESNNAELPLLTSIVITASETLQEHWLLVAILIFMSNISSKYFYKKSFSFKHLVDRLMLKVPVFGPLVRKSILVRVTRTVAIMFRAGIPMVETLGVIAPASGNEVFRRALSQVQNDIATGQPLESSLREAKQFPSMILQMVRTGEETGEMDSMLDKVAEFYEDEVDNTISGISALVEPIMVVVLGILIGIVVVAMYLPIFKLGDVF